MAIPDVLRSLLTAPGPSGYEKEAAAVFADAARGFTDDVVTDAMGSTVARVKGASEGPLFAVMGHIDEIGLLVSHIDDKGFLWFQGVGGWDPVILIGQRVELVTRSGRIPGVVGKKPIHLLKEDERKQAAKLTDLHIDIGAKDGDEAKGLVRIGDVAVIAGEPFELPNGRAVSRSMDNRLGSYVAYEVARRVADEGGLSCNVAGVAAVQEEITFAGAHTTAYSLSPDVAVVVDVTHETDAPGIEVKTIGAAPFGSGAAIGRGSTLHPVVTEGLITAAEENGIPYSISPSTRYTGTDADAVHMSRAGIPTGCVSIPLRYMHSPVEMVDMADVEAVVSVLVAYAKTLSAESSFER